MTNYVDLQFAFSDGSVDSVTSLRPGSSEIRTNIVPGRFTPYVVPSRRYFAPYFHRQPARLSRSDFLMTSGDQGFMQQRGPSLNMFEERLFTIDANELNRQRFNSIVRRIIPRGVNWTIDQSEAYQYVLRFLGDNKAHSAEGVGEGIASLFTLIAALYDSVPGDVIVIDEPELSLHPTYQKRLIKVLCEFAANRQIVISTHSPYMIDDASVQNGANIVRAWDRGTGTQLFQLGIGGAASWKALTKPNLHFPHQFGTNAKEVFFLEDGIVIVEGQEV